MITKRTVLILGAGASTPYGLPLGCELRDEVIRNRLDAKRHINYPSPRITPERYAAFADNLSRSGHSSVDGFLEKRRQWLDIGKYAIGHSLLKSEAENAKKLFPPHQPKDHWYEALWQALEAPTWHEFTQNPIAIVTFNYDRTLEHYLVSVLCNHYDISPKTALDGLSSLPVIHVHGSLGEYDDARFGGEVHPNWIELARKSILIVHEDNEARSAFPKVRRCLKNADRILFIGFGYHQPNMNKLGLGDVNSVENTIGRRMIRSSKVLGTHKGIKKYHWKRICQHYDFEWEAIDEGAGTISEFIRDWLE